MIEIENLKLYDLEDLAEICCCSIRTLRRDMNADKLKGIYIGRAWYFTRAMIDEYMQRKGSDI